MSSSSHRIADELVGPAAVLARAESALAQRREGDLTELVVCLEWSDLHSGDPRDEPGHSPVRGGERLVRLGGEGTPMVRDLTLLEMGVALGRHPLGVRSMTADALDLRHRLPRTWRRVMDLEADAWVARRVASLSRGVPLAGMEIVDAAVAVAIAGVAPSRLVEIAEAAVIEADPAGHRLRVETERARRYVGLSRPDSSGLRMLIARITSADAAWIDGVVDRLADVLAARSASADPPEEQTSDQLRAEALGMLARPAEVLALLAAEGDGPSGDDGRDDDPGLPGELPDPDEPSRAFALPGDVLDRLTPQVLDRLRPTATLFVHLHQAALEPSAGAAGVVRPEGLAPLDVRQLADLLGHHRIAVKPVIDSGEHHAVDAYEHPVWMRERIFLKRPADGFPHASARGRGLDLDHPVPWVDPDHGGPPGQTTTGSQPLSRTAHRARTHLGYTVTPTPAGVVWRTPHGLHRLVDADGVTHRLTAEESDVLVHGEDGWDRVLRRLLDDARRKL